jgi:hypothetical protein
MKKILSIVLCILFTSTIAGCSSKETTESGLAKEMNVFIWSEYVFDVIKGFERKV